MTSKIRSSPFIHNKQTTQQIMIQVMVACLPGLVTSVYFFYSGVIIQLILSCITALIAESLVLKLRCQPIILQLSNGSALLTAMLLALSIPPLAPWWMIVIATTFAIVIAKQLYGGLGCNPFNPAMIGYVVLLISFPVQMTNWLPQKNLLLHSISITDNIWLILTGVTQDGLTLAQLCSATIDGITQATPLDSFKTRLNIDSITTTHNHLDWKTSAGWIWSNISFLLGGVYLIWRKVISWHIPFNIIITIIICTELGQWLAPEVSTHISLHLFSGATMLGAFFVATDPVTATITVKGQVFFGILIGLLVWLIRTWGEYPDGIAFAVLLANICVPLIDHYTQPRTYGHH